MFLGFYGLYCDKPCQEGYFGQSCKKKCDCKNDGICDPVTGKQLHFFSHPFFSAFNMNN